MNSDRDRIETAIRHCLKAKEQLDLRNGYRTRVLIDMLLIELRRDLACLGGMGLP